MPKQNTNLYLIAVHLRGKRSFLESSPWLSQVSFAYVQFWNIGLEDEQIKPFDTPATPAFFKQWSDQSTYPCLPVQLFLFLYVSTHVLTSSTNYR